MSATTTVPMFLDEYQPATATETQLVQELADTAWRLNRIADLFGIPWDPADHGFVLSKGQVERCSQRRMRQNEARTIAYVAVVDAVSMPSRRFPYAILVSSAS